MGAVQGEGTAAWMEGATFERERGGWPGSVLERELTGLAHVGGRKTCVEDWASSRGPLKVPVKMPGRQFGRWAGTPGGFKSWWED